MGDRKINQRQFKEAMKSLRGKLPEGKLEKIEGVFGSRFAEGAEHITEKEFKKGMEHFEKNPSYGVTGEHIEHAREAFGTEFSKKRY